MMIIFSIFFIPEVVVVLVVAADQAHGSFSIQKIILK